MADSYSNDSWLYSLLIGSEDGRYDDSWLRDLVPMDIRGFQTGDSIAFEGKRQDIERQIAEDEEFFQRTGQNPKPAEDKSPFVPLPGTPEAYSRQTASQRMMAWLEREERRREMERQQIEEKSKEIHPQNNPIASLDD